MTTEHHDTARDLDAGAGDDLDAFGLERLARYRGNAGATTERSRGKFVPAAETVALSGNWLPGGMSKT